MGVESVFHCSSRRKHDNLWIKVMLQITICFSFFSSPLCPHFLLLLLRWWAVMIKFDVEKAWVTLPPCGLFLSLMTPCTCKCHMPTRSLLPNSREMAWVTFDVDMQHFPNAPLRRQKGILNRLGASSRCEGKENYDWGVLLPQKLSLNRSFNSRSYLKAFFRTI